MNDGDMGDRHDAELERRLDAYARARLSPDEATAARLRAQVMRAAYRLSPTNTHEPGTEPESAGVVVPLAPRRRRRVLPALLAASLALLALAGGALAARPGGPLYEARLAIEELFLPSGPDARAAADLGRLENRLSELVDAASSGDPAAVAAALAAYRELVEETSAAAGVSDVRDAALEAALARHLEVLADVLTRVPEQARPGIEQAIERSDRAVDRIHQQIGRDPTPGNEPVSTPSKKPTGQSGKPDRTPPGPPSERPSRAP